MGFSTAGISVALVACSEEPTAATERMEAPAEEFASAFSSATPDLARHVTASQGGYEITFDPAWSSRSLVQPADGGAMTELYRQKGSYDLAGGEIPKQHEIRLTGGAFNRDITLAVFDPKHAIARIHVSMHHRGHAHHGEAEGSTAGIDGEATETVTIMNHPVCCPPDCDGEVTAGMFNLDQATPRAPSLAADRLTSAAEHRVVSENGYSVAFHPGFTRHASVSIPGQDPIELFRQSADSRVSAGTSSSATLHEVQIRGGAYDRNVAMRVNDPGKVITRIVLELHGPDYVPGSGEASDPVEVITLQR